SEALPRQIPAILLRNPKRQQQGSWATRSGLSKRAFEPIRASQRTLRFEFSRPFRFSRQIHELAGVDLMVVEFLAVAQAMPGVIAEAICPHGEAANLFKSNLRKRGLLEGLRWPRQQRLHAMAFEFGWRLQSAQVRQCGV